MKVLSEFVVLQRFYHAMAIDFCFLVEGDESEGFWVQCSILERRLHFIVIVRAHGGILTGSAEGGMKFFLHTYECLISLIGELNIPQDGGDHVRPDLFDLDILAITDGSTTILVVGLESVILGVSICSR